MKGLKKFPERIQKMVDFVGSKRGLARMFGVSDLTIMGWLGGSTPYESTLFRISNDIGIDLDWLKYGSGDESAELQKLRSFENNPRGRLKSARIKSGLSIQQFAKLIGYQAGVLQAVEDGNARISEKMAEAICKVLPDLNKEELLAGSDSPPIITETGATGTFGAKPNIRLTGNMKSARYVPFLSRAQAGMLDSGFVDEAYDYEGELAIDIDDPKAFALEIRGNSMEPQIMEGDRAVVCPSWKPRAGETVICRTVDGDVMCKLFQSKKGGELIVLSSYNPAYPPIELKREEVSWIYPVGQMSRKMRRD